MRDVLEVTVPLRWRGLPWGDDSVPVSWLTEEGDEHVHEGEDPPPEAVRLRFRPLTMRERVKVQMAMDDLCGGPAATVDLESGFAAHQALLLVKYEDELWPEGRPEATTPEETQEQLNQINTLLFSDTSDEAKAYRRIADLLAQTRLRAEMAALIDGPKRWRKFAEEVDLTEEAMNAVEDAYRRAKAEAEARSGKRRRSGL